MRMHKVREAKVTQGFDTVVHNQHVSSLMCFALLIEREKDDVLAY